MRCASLMLAGGFLLIAAAAADAQDTEIRGAAIALVPTRAVVDRVTIANQRDSPLVAWEIYWPAEDGGGQTIASDFVLQMVPAGPHEHSIKHGERRTIEAPAQEGRMRGSPMLQFAVFEDGHIDGVPDAVERWQRAREEHMDDLAYWIRALQSMPRDSEESARQYLAARVAERPASASSRNAGVRARILDIAQLFSRAEPGPLFARAERVREEAERHLAALKRMSTLPQRLEAPTPVVVSSDRIVRTHYVASVVNHRDVAIEAFGFEVLESGGDRPRWGQTEDHCLADTADAGARSRGRIAARDTREVPLSVAVEDAPRLPTVRLTFVLFDDLLFEGNTAERERLFMRREHQADDLAFANRVRRELAAVAVDAVHAFLMEKRTERIQQLLAQGRRPDVHTLDDMIEQARRAPERLRESALATTEAVEAQRQRLLRHIR